MYFSKKMSYSLIIAICVIGIGTSSLLLAEGDFPLVYRAAHTQKSMLRVEHSSSIEMGLSRVIHKNNSASSIEFINTLNGSTIIPISNAYKRFAFFSVTGRLIGQGTTQGTASLTVPEYAPRGLVCLKLMVE
ncbi:MAG: hypothetical protein OCD01_03240 [Fibrobacterales bacterium]